METIAVLYYGWLYAIKGAERVKAGPGEPYNWRCRWVALCENHAKRKWQAYMLWEFDCRYAARPAEGEGCYSCNIGAEHGNTEPYTGPTEVRRAA